MIRTSLLAASSSQVTMTEDRHEHLLNHDEFYSLSILVRVILLLTCGGIAIVAGISLSLYVSTKSGGSLQGLVQPNNNGELSVPVHSSTFEISFRYTTAMTDEQRQVFENAKLDWERVLVKDFTGTVRAVKGVSICNQPPLNEDLLIDNIIIFAGKRVLSLFYIKNVV